MSIPQGSFDAVIIGAGPVGLNIAKVLTDRGKRVLILEAGRAPISSRQLRASFTVSLSEMGKPSILTIQLVTQIRRSLISSKNLGSKCTS